jgi:DNA-binding CsgD family transcriptional regulator
MSNPRIGPAMAATVGTWMHCHQHFDESYVAQSRFYQEFLIPHGGRYLSSAKLVENEETVFMIGLMRGQGSAPLSDADWPLLSTIQRQARDAMLDFLHLRRTLADTGIARELLARFERPMLAIDETRGIWHHNPAADALLGRGELLRERAGLLHISDLKADAALTEALHHLNLGAQEATEATRRQVVRMERADGKPLLLLLSALRPEHSMHAFGPKPVALVIAHTPGESGAVLDPLVVAECFDFTPAEARVATLLAGGSSIEEIASRQHTSVATVRTQAQRAIEKAGVTRQVDLVRVILQLP